MLSTLICCIYNILPSINPLPPIRKWHLQLYKYISITHLISQKKISLSPHFNVRLQLSRTYCYSSKSKYKKKVLWIFLPDSTISLCLVFGPVKRRHTGIKSTPLSLNFTWECNKNTYFWRQLRRTDMWA